MKEHAERTANRRVKVAMIGSRGFPGQRAGVERVLESVCKRLVATGQADVRVYCVGDLEHDGDDYEGVELRRINGLRTKHADTYTRSLIATLKELRSDSDVIHYHGIGSAVFAILPRLAGKKVVVTVHALDWQRSKWGGLAKRYLRFGEWASMKFPHRTVAVSDVLREDLEDRYSSTVAFISNGAEPRCATPVDKIAAAGLEHRRFVLFVGRLVPEKGVHMLIEAFRSLPYDSDMKLAIAGPRWFEREYDRQLVELAGDDERIVFLGEVGDERLAELYSNCSAFVLPSDVEGMSLSLLDAMAFGSAIVTSSIPANERLVEEAALVFRAGDVDDLRAALSKVLDDESVADELRRAARSRATGRFNWDSIAIEWVDLYTELCK